MTLPAFEKAPGELLDYMVDWTVWLGSDTILTSTWVLPAPLVTGNASNTTLTATQFIGGGQVGTDYIVLNIIVTAGGRTAARAFTIQVRQR